MHTTFFPEGMIVLAVFLTVPIVLWRVSRHTSRWIRLPLRGVALAMIAVVLWNVFAA